MSFVNQAVQTKILSNSKVSSVSTRKTTIRCCTEDSEEFQQSVKHRRVSSETYNPIFVKEDNQVQSILNVFDTLNQSDPIPIVPSNKTDDK